VHGLCVVTSNSGTVSHSNGYLANVFLTECETLPSHWTFANGTLQAGGQCLDVGSGGSRGDLGFEFELQPAAPLAQQAFHSDSYVSWGGSVIKAGASDGGSYHMFAAVFAGGKGNQQRDYAAGVQDA
jgi:hypothetical protein